MSIHAKPGTIPDVSSDWTWLRWCVFPAAFVTSLYGWALLVSTFIRPGSIGLNLIAPGTDWMVFYGAVRSALAGHLQLLMNGDDFTAYLNRAFADWLSSPLEFRPWFYPPSCLILLLPLHRSASSAHILPSRSPAQAFSQPPSRMAPMPLPAAT